MNMSVSPALLLDLLLVVALVISMLRGAKRGFVLTLCSLMAVIVALVGANFLADTLTPAVSRAIEPTIEATIQTTLESQGQSLQDIATGETLTAIREKGGLYAFVADAMSDALDKMDLTPVVARVATQAATAVAEQLAHGLLFLVAFFLVLLAWTLLSHALDLVAKLPGLNSLNGLLGGVAGLVKGLILVYILVWGLYTLTGTVSQETAQQTHLFLFLTQHGPLELLMAGQALLGE